MSPLSVRRKNEYEVVRARKLNTCKNCGEPNLAWVQLDSGKWALVSTTTERPSDLDPGEPELASGMVYANRASYHRCWDDVLARTRQNIVRDIDTATEQLYHAMNAQNYKLIGKVFLKLTRIRAHADSEAKKIFF